MFTNELTPEQIARFQTVLESSAEMLEEAIPDDMMSRISNLTTLHDVAMITCDLAWDVESFAALASQICLNDKRLMPIPVFDSSLVRHILADRIITVDESELFST